jgi:hypothetical protein
MKIRSPQDCQLFQNDLDRLSAWCHNNKFNLNVAKCKSISFCRNTHPIDYAYSINGKILDKVDEFKDLGVIVDQKMTFLPHIESVVSKSSRMLGFIKRLSKDFHDPYTHKILYTTFVRSNLEYATCVWSPHQAIHSDRLERIQRNFIRFALRQLGWISNPLPPYVERCGLISLDTLADRRIMSSAIFARDILCERIDSVGLAPLLRFENVPYARRRNAKLVQFFHRRNYGKFEPVNNAIINFNKYCDWFGFSYTESRETFRRKMLSALLDVRLGR